MILKFILPRPARGRIFICHYCNALGYFHLTLDAKEITTKHSMLESPNPDPSYGKRPVTFTADIYIVSPKDLIETIKDALEQKLLLHRTKKIIKFGNNQSFSAICGVSEETVVNTIPTNLALVIPETASAQAVLTARFDELVLDLGVSSYASRISLAIRDSETYSNGQGYVPKALKQGNLVRIVQTWLEDLPSQTQASLPLTIPELLSLGSWTYTIYSPLLLLSPTAFKREPWQMILKADLASELPALYNLICTRLHVTHIAINAPISFFAASSPNAENVLRSPSSLTTLHGDFNVVQPSSPKAFEEAFWVSTRQHGVSQTWSPLYTMFSRGNISEKARILSMPGLKASAGSPQSAETSVVDLYAGVGYFAFFYVKAGASKILCWELNPWSVEGLRRGAGMNHWSVVVANENHAWETEPELEQARLIVFQEDNKKASVQIEKMRKRIPPVRHVNCGFLPSSRESWSTAVAVLDPVQGGWIHAHENIAVKDIDGTRATITRIFDNLVNLESGSLRRAVSCKHLERVKSYAPGVMHCVLDIHIAPAAMPPHTTDAITNQLMYST